MSNHVALTLKQKISVGELYVLLRWCKKYIDQSINIFSIKLIMDINLYSKLQQKVDEIEERYPDDRDTRFRLETVLFHIRFTLSPAIFLSNLLEFNKPQLHERIIREAWQEYNEKINSFYSFICDNTENSIVAFFEKELPRVKEWSYAKDKNFLSLNTHETLLKLITQEYKSIIKTGNLMIKFFKTMVITSYLKKPLQNKPSQ